MKNNLDSKQVVCDASNSDRQSTYIWFMSETLEMKRDAIDWREWKEANKN